VGRVHRINVNPSGGVPKQRVPAVRLLAGGVEGDRQRNLKHHGGPDRAVSLFALERIQALSAEGHPIGPGTAGENLTVEGLDWEAVRPGERLAVGEAVLEVTSFAAPCTTIRDSFQGREFTRISEKVHPGWSRVYARVLREGLVREGDVIERLSQAGPMT
jgi:MOSC domain-containing protein YiiM